MTVEIKVPALGESVTEATIARWLKQPGEAVARDEPLVELETDKVTLEVNAPAAGKLEAITADAGATVAVGAVLGTLADGVAAEAPKPAARPEPAKAAPAGGTPVMPAARKLAADQGVDTAAIAGTGKGGRVTKQDVQASIKTEPAPKPQPPVKEPEPPPAPVREPEPKREPPPSPPPGERARADREERVRMTRLRRTIAARLKQAQNTAAMLTTFNEVDMTALMALRQGYREGFEKKHGVRLGYMSFFVKACITALREIPAVNGEVDGEDIVYKNYYDIGVAVGTPQGLVVPVVRDADTMSFAELEKRIAELGTKARDGKLALSDLTGGTFSISNGGVYGSLLSTPILNPPQSAILGMHKIQERPVAVAGKVEVRPMMYLALSYDHRIVDGREAVTFLVRVKECLEDPQRILLDV